MPQLAVVTTGPQELIDFVRKEIRKGPPTVRTWELDAEDDLRHTGENNRWYNDFYVRPTAQSDYAEFRLHAVTGKKLTGDAVGVILGALLSFFIRHCVSAQGEAFYSAIIYRDD